MDAFKYVAARMEERAIQSVEIVFAFQQQEGSFVKSGVVQVSSSCCDYIFSFRQYF